MLGLNWKSIYLVTNRGARIKNKDTPDDLGLVDQDQVFLKVKDEEAWERAWEAKEAKALEVAIMEDAWQEKVAEMEEEQAAWEDYAQSEAEAKEEEVAREAEAARLEAEVCWVAQHPPYTKHHTHHTPHTTSPTSQHTIHQGRGRGRTQG